MSSVRRALASLCLVAGCRTAAAPAAGASAAMAPAAERVTVESGVLEGVREGAVVAWSSGEQPV
jgi:hypothetical protein